MQYFESNSILIATIIILSWLVAFLFNYAMTYFLIRRWKSWEDMNDREQSSILGAFSLGGILGIMVWWIYASGALTGNPLLVLFDIPVLLIWAAILIFAASAGGVLMLRR